MDYPTVSKYTISNAKFVSQAMNSTPITNVSRSTPIVSRKTSGIDASSAIRATGWIRTAFAQVRNGAATMLMEDAPPAELPSSTSPSHNHAKSMAVLNISLEVANPATKDTHSSTTPANCQTALFPTKENVSNATPTTSSNQTAPACPKTSSARRWMSSVPASSVWTATTTPKRTRNASKRNQAVNTTKKESALLATTPSSSKTADAVSRAA